MKFAWRSIRTWKAILWLLPMFIMAGPSLAVGGDWNAFSRSMNSNFNNDQGFRPSEITVLILVIVVVVLLVGIIRWYGDREVQEQRESYELYKERQKQAASSTPGQQHNRKWFRLRTRAELRWIPAELAEKVRENRYNSDHLVDISAEGLCFSTSAPLEPDDELIFLLDSGEGFNLTLNGRVLRIFEANGQDTTINNVAIKFGHVSPGESDRLVAWITKRQRDAIHPEDKAETPGLN